jgi:hypothetical protein
MVLAVAANTYVFTHADPLDYPPVVETVFHTVGVLYIFASVLLVYFVLRISASDEIVGQGIVTVAYWAGIPAAVAVTLSNTDQGLHDCALLAWDWALRPLPIEVLKPLAIEVPSLRIGLWGGVALIFMQLATIGLVLGGLATIWKAWSAGEG